MMISLSSLYFLIYFLVFVFVGVIASMFIVPLLTVSFIFASCVVVFGFLSDITFKFAQMIYFKTDYRLKSTLNKMGHHSQVSDSDCRPQLMKNYTSARIRNGSQPTSGSTTGNASVITYSRTFEPGADMRVTT